MLLNKTNVSLLWTIFAIFLSGCVSKTEYVYKCPFGVGYLTQKDYETMQCPDLISEQFITWLITTNEYCKEGEV